jgi:Na+-driven multidrug efflux pump
MLPSRPASRINRFHFHVRRYGSTPPTSATGTVGLMFVLIPRTLFGLFGMDDPVALSLGDELLAYLSVSGLFIMVALAYTGGLQGTGDTRSPLYISLTSQVALPLGLCALIQHLRGLHPSDIWVAILLGHFSRSVLSMLRFRQGKWRDTVVEIAPQRKGGVLGRMPELRWQRNRTGLHHWLFS